MEKILKSAILLLILSCQLRCIGQKISYIYIKDIPATADYVEDFKKVSDNVNEKYTHLKDKNINGIILQNEYLAKVKNAKTNLEYGSLLIQYFASLNNSHSNAIFKKFYINCSALLLDNHVFISYIGDSVFLKNGIKEKDEILKINNSPVLTYIRNESKFTSASTDLHRTYLTVSGLFSSYFEESRTYTIKTSSGEKDVTIHFGETPLDKTSTTSNQTPGKIESKILNDSVAYISILSMTGNVVEEFIKAFDTLSRKPFLIIDVRRNQGGNSGNSEKIAEYLISEKQKACVSNRWLNPKDNHFTGRLFILTSPYTVSAAESFVLDLLESNNATIIGMPTAGDTGNQPQFYSSTLGYSYWFPSRNKAQVSPKGFPMEGESIKPHLAVSKTIADFFDNKDTILEYVLTLIKNK
ncbi:S41 family peptidase [Polluticaenibacter yanchengensis]|uniref:S41 family peptidase n=1 Tax=Polluticaenibacter yanchengensis TaxID=3014562 RepID=A0ABT4UIX5_9BACT|nr:S41 family peptidase [Chitinophagaceae bacterium LY-5]